MRIVARACFELVRSALLVGRVPIQANFACDEQCASQSGRRNGWPHLSHFARVRTMPQNLSAPVKIGVVGLGRFGRLQALTLARLAEAELVGLVARRQSSLDRLSAEFPGVRGWTSLEQALEVTPSPKPEPGDV